MALITGKSCRGCKFGEPVGADKAGTMMIECRRFPPVGIPIPFPVSAGVVGIQIHAGYPRVDPDKPCGEYVQRLAIAASETVIPQLAA